MTAVTTSRDVTRAGDGFWARQTHKDKISIVAFAATLGISIVLLLLGALIPEAKLSMGARIAIFTGNIVALVTALQFAISRFFDDQKEHIDKLGDELEDVKGRISKTLEEMESITGLGETYIKIFRQEEKIKNQYQSTLDTFLRRLSN